ncbi:MAG: hypothetical protein GEU28_06980 [Dehalococcoidia bacterium]|nr:hypothetical protein [Dehalococcoidia bacterium]
MKGFLALGGIAVAGVVLMISGACGDNDDDDEPIEDVTTEDTPGEGSPTPGAGGQDEGGGPLPVDEGVAETSTPPSLVLAQGATTMEGVLGNFGWDGVIADAFAVVTEAEAMPLGAAALTLTTDEDFNEGVFTL